MYTILKLSFNIVYNPVYFTEKYIIHSAFLFALYKFPDLFIVIVDLFVYSLLNFFVRIFNCPVRWMSVIWEPWINFTPVWLKIRNSCYKKCIIRGNIIKDIWDKCVKTIACIINFMIINYVICPNLKNYYIRCVFGKIITWCYSFIYSVSSPLRFAEPQYGHPASSSSNSAPQLVQTIFCPITFILYLPYSALTIPYLIIKAKQKRPSGPFTRAISCHCFLKKLRYQRLRDDIIIIVP